MKVLIRKMKGLGLLGVEMVLGTLIMAAALIGLPVSIAVFDVTMLANPTVLGVVAIGMFFFAFVAFVCFVRPFILYRKYPEVQAETDGEFLYVHANKEVKIPLAEITEVTVRYELPYIYQKEFISDILIHLFSEEYGTVFLDIEGHGSYKMRFVSQARKSSDELFAFLEGVINN